MPLYDFHCSECGRDFELFLRPREARQGVECPSCGRPVSPKPPQAEGASSPAACSLNKRT